MKSAGLAYTEPTAVDAEMSGMAFSCTSDRQASRFGTHVAMAAWFSAVILIAMLSGCSPESSKPAAPEVKPAELLTARSAFQKMYIAAHLWSQDAKPYRLEALITTDGNGHDGKWAEWRGSFASADKRLEKSYIWSGSAASSAPERGVNPGIEDGYSAGNSSTQIFDVAFLKIDSDQALAEAQKHGGEELLQKEPDTPVFYICDWNRNTNTPVWHVIYGASRETAKLTVAVDASTGFFLKVEK